MTSAAREAFVLPGALLTVVILGSVRFAQTTALMPPSPFALVLGLLLLRVVVQSGALAPERLLAASRSALANLNGVSVLLALWLAAAQAMALLIPDTGLPRIGLGVFLLILLVNTSAADPDRVRLLRSLAVTFGALFLLKFVALAELSAPGTGRVKRVLQAMLDGVTLGALLQPSSPPAAAYVALTALALFLVALVLLPSRPPTEAGGAMLQRRGSSLEHR